MIPKEEFVRKAVTENWFALLNEEGENSFVLRGDAIEVAKELAEIVWEFLDKIEKIKQKWYNKYYDGAFGIEDTATRDAILEVIAEYL